MKIQIHTNVVCEVKFSGFCSFHLAIKHNLWPFRWPFILLFISDLVLYLRSNGSVCLPISLFGYLFIFPSYPAVEKKAKQSAHLNRI